MEGSVGGVLQRFRLLLVVVFMCVLVAAAPYCRGAAVGESAPETVEAALESPSAIAEAGAAAAAATHSSPTASMGPRHRDSTASIRPRSRRSSRSAASVNRSHASSGRRGGSSRSSRSSSRSSSNRGDQWLPSAAGYASTALLGLLIAYVLLAERRTAAATAAHEKELEQGLVAAESRKAAEYAIEREKEFCAATARELEHLRIEMLQTSELLLQLEERRDTVVAKAAAKAAESKAHESKELEALRKRVQAALAANYEAHVSLDVAQLLWGVADDAAAADLLQQLQQESSMLDAEETRLQTALQTLKQSESVESVLASKQKQLDELTELLKGSKEELDKLKAETAAQQPEALAAEDAAVSAAVQQLEAELQQLLQKQKQERKSPANQQQLMEEVQKAQEEKQQLQQELEELTIAPTMYKVRDRALEEAAAVLKENMDFLNRVVTPRPSVIKNPSYIEHEKNMYPEEMELLLSRQELLRLETRERTLEAEALLLEQGTAEEVQVAHALCRLLRAKATASAEELQFKGSSGAALAEQLLQTIETATAAAGAAAPAGNAEDAGAAATTAAAIPGPQEVLVQEAEAAAARLEPESVRQARAVLAAAEQDLEDKATAERSVAAELDWLGRVIPEVQERVEEDFRAVDLLRQTIARRTSDPQGFAFAAVEDRARKADNRVRLMRMIKSCHSDFSADMFKQVDESADPQQLWVYHLERTADEYVVGAQELMELYSEMRLSSGEAGNAFWKLRLEEGLQELPLGVLMEKVVEGPSGELQQQYTNSRYDEVQTELVVLKQQRRTYLQNREEVKQGLAFIAAANYWENDLPKSLINAHAYLIRLSEAIKYLDERQRRLERITKEQIRDEVSASFLNALWEAFRRQKDYEKDATVIEKVHEANMEALAESERQSQDTLSRADKREAELCPTVNRLSLPLVLPPPARSDSGKTAEEKEEEVMTEIPGAQRVRAFDELVGLTLPNVMKLRKKSSKSDSKPSKTQRRV
ncbi:hypothetical protein, conserved [Eimeria maxima]|uniref:Uncharacterized protein n=1 Tax=Eimeria maxima TaxID=5804 RepID=U6M339_EIMMA|nr:hypothetical protein, conserved [Eimeria maxima]CDJ58441.1 hypothetical protein, conserved [Eimeria maxima]